MRNGADGFPVKMGNGVPIPERWLFIRERYGARDAHALSGELAAISRALDDTSLAYGSETASDRDEWKNKRDILNEMLREFRGEEAEGNGKLKITE